LVLLGASERGPGADIALVIAAGRAQAAPDPNNGLLRLENCR
jgi:hypothetical protein